MKVQPAFTRPFNANWTPPQHHRAADIDRDQPSFTAAVKARGNGDERQHGYGRGQ